MVLRATPPDGTPAGGVRGARADGVKSGVESLFATIAIARVDALLVGAGVLFGAASLAFPFGHDQGVHYYVGREWLQHGALPYRDTFDYKTPGIYLLYAALIAVFGEGMWPIRLAELACVVWLGIVVARIVEEKPPEGMLGLSVFLASFSYYGFFNYWDTAQCELPCLALSFAAILESARGCVRPRSWAATGLFAGAALLMKPSAAGFVAIAFAISIVRARARAGTALAVLLGAVVVLPAAILGFFILHGGMPAVTEIISADRAYIADTRWVRSASDLWHVSLATFTSFHPFSALLLAAIVERATRATLTRSQTTVRRLALPAATVVAAYIGVAAQLKFYRYHSVLFVGPGVLLAITLARDVVDGWRVSFRAGASVLALLVLCAFPLSGANASNWFDENASVIGIVDGVLTRERFDHQFTAPKLFYDFGDSEACGLWLREHSSPDDTIAVRGFEAEVYAVARRRFTGRFFWTIPLTDPQRTFKRDEWLAADLAELKATPPRFVVVLADARAPAEGAQYFAPLGYHPIKRFGLLVVLGKEWPP